MDLEAFKRWKRIPRPVWGIFAYVALFWKQKKGEEGATGLMNDLQENI